MNPRVMFLPQGMMIGDVIEEDGQNLTVKNPALVITQPGKGVGIVPFLHVVTEDTVTIDLNEAGFKQTFTPIPDLADHYQKTFSPIITPPSAGAPLNLT